jgi:hypothetical protein
VFLSKSAQNIENKGREGGKKLQESSRVRKGLEGKEIGEKQEEKGWGRGVKLVLRGDKTKVKRVFTSHGTKE